MDPLHPADDAHGGDALDDDMHGDDMYGDDAHGGASPEPSQERSRIAPSARVITRRGRRGDPRRQGDADAAEDPAHEDLESPPRPRQATVQRALGGQSTVLRGVLALGGVVVLGGLYLFTPVFGGSGAQNKPDQVANPLGPESRIGTDLMVAARAQNDAGAQDPLVAATAPDVALLPDVQSVNGDIDGLLARLDARQAKLDDLAQKLADAERGHDVARGDVDRLKKELKAAKQGAATERKTHAADIRALKQQHKLDVARAVAEAMAKMPVYPQQVDQSGLTPEELRLLEERRRQRAAQLRSKSIVYDIVTE